MISAPVTSTRMQALNVLDKLSGEKYFKGKKYEMETLMTINGRKRSLRIFFYRELSQTQTKEVCDEWVEGEGKTMFLDHGNEVLSFSNF